MAQQLAEHRDLPLRPILAKLHGTLTNKPNLQGKHGRLRTILTRFRGVTKQASSDTLQQEIIADLSTIELVLPHLNPEQKASDPRLDLIERATSGRILIVLGYSGGDDFDIMPLLMQARGIRAVVWIEHATESSGQVHVRDGNREYARDQFTDQMSYRHSWGDALAGNGTPVLILRGNTSEILNALNDFFKVDTKKTDEVQDQTPTAPEPIDGRLKEIYDRRPELDWALLLGCLLSTANEDELACLTFGTCFERDRKLSTSSLDRRFIEECYLHSLWRWDYLHYTPFYRRTMAEQIAKGISSPIPLGLEPTIVQVYRCVYHQTPLGTILAAEECHDFWEPKGSDAGLKRRRQLEREILELELLIEAEPQAYRDRMGLFE